MLIRSILSQTTKGSLFSRATCLVSQKGCLFCGRPSNQVIDHEAPQPQNEGSFIVPDERPLPVITSRKLNYPEPYLPPKQAWLESLQTHEDQKLGLIDLHPLIFGVYPRIDVIHQNIVWQRTYRNINYECTRSRAEMPGGGRKPWPQKGTGRARHGSIRSPIWKNGGRAKGPRGPMAYFYMLPFQQRILALRSTLSIKYAQDDLHVIEELETPTDDPEFLQELADVRYWGDSVLFVDDTDVLTRNVARALKEIPHFSAMPVYGLNVYSMLKHQTLVLTLAAVERIEERLLHHMHTTRRDSKQKVLRSPSSSQYFSTKTKTVIDYD
ncbi:hypothetical protein BaRGS_00004477 [Batillaria attramentaria]|uniref:Large ribosomal subunit protein uL4m n=1 Tax=Batillaria attramentaria TaxID=370345 RepID=A0ABD0LXM4_9CAEN